MKFMVFYKFVSADSLCYFRPDVISLFRSAEKLSKKKKFKNVTQCGVADIALIVAPAVISYICCTIGIHILL